MNQPPVDNPEYRTALKMIEKQSKNMSTHPADFDDYMQSVRHPVRTDTERLDWLGKPIGHSLGRDWIDRQMAIDSGIKGISPCVTHSPPPKPERRHKIVQACNARALDEMVNYYISKGAELSGGPFTVPCGWLAQAILWVPMEGEK